MITNMLMHYFFAQY